MARKPNYDFERRERDRLKAEKKALRAAAKKEAREQNATADDQTDAEAETESPPTDDA